MKTSTHYSIVRWLKVGLFAAFMANIIRILYRTWKYGGSKSTYEVTFDGQNGPIVDDDDVNDAIDGLQF